LRQNSRKNTNVRNIEEFIIPEEVLE